MFKDILHSILLLISCSKSGNKQPDCEESGTEFTTCIVMMIGLG